jgi:septal ring factor EnvC (AmiA/AmiB activator)
MLKRLLLTASFTYFLLVKTIKITSFILLLVLTPLIVSAQSEDIDEDIQFHSRELDRLRQEIENFRHQIKSTADQEKSTETKIQELDEEISLIQNLLDRLREEEKSKEEAIKEAGTLIQEKEKEFDELRNKYARRVVNIYKTGKPSELKMIINRDSWRDRVYREEYLKVISQYDRELASKIQQVIAQIDAEKKTLERELEDKKIINSEKTSQKLGLEKKRSGRNEEIAKLKSKKQELKQELGDRQEAVRKMETIIAQLEREKENRNKELERRRREDSLLAGGDFSVMKGSLPWPVKGPVISKFGSHKNPTLKTITENTGVDIKSDAGSKVQAVFSGIVTTVTYIRGYGNTVIIDHGAGFYTVYTHVDDVEVNENVYVKARQIIAHVGKPDTGNSSKLHFEIWGNREKLNPEHWLSKG